MKHPKAYSFGEINDSALIEWVKLGISWIVNLSYLAIIISWAIAIIVLAYKGLFWQLAVIVLGPPIAIKMLFRKKREVLM